MNRVERDLDICVHVPKNGGITWRGLLIDKYGPDRVFGSDVRSGRLSSMEAQGFKADNSQRGWRETLGKNTPALIAQAVAAVRDRKIGEDPSLALSKARVVIGHFAVDTFDAYPQSQDAEYNTVLRDPLVRMVSHYKYLNQLEKLMPRMRHWGEAHNAGRPFTEFALDPMLQNYQAQFVGDNLRRYSLVGVAENLPEFFTTAGLIGASEPVARLNGTTWTGEAIGVGDPGFVRDFTKFHEIDYILHQEARELVNARNS